MNQTFSLSRFGRLLRTHLSDNRGALLTNVLLLIGVLVAIDLFFYNSYPDDVDRNRSIVFFLTGWVAWYMFIVQQVVVLNEKERTISYLLRPASLIEKYLLIVMVSGIGFIVVYLTVFTLLDAVGVSYVNHRNWTPDQLERIRSIDGKLHIEPLYRSETWYYMPASVVVFSILLHPVALTFALFIRRFTFPLVAVVILTLGMVGMVSNEYILNGLLAQSEVYKGMPFSDIVVGRNNTLRSIELSGSLGNPLRYVVATAVFMLLYATAYFRLKEREV